MVAVVQPRRGRFREASTSGAAAEAKACACWLAMDASIGPIVVHGAMGPNM